MIRSRRAARVELYVQQARMEARYPGFSAQLVGLRKEQPKLILKGRVQPTEMTAEYAIRIEYDGATRPRVFVVDPMLRPRQEDEKIPHTWGPNEPCLYYRGDWKVGVPISDSIIPWTMLWLSFYEAWRVTGQWQGGGVEHEAQPGKA